ncbi:hypothetical protein RB195_004221 [Necator americanus]|uniref:phosphoethanolamine N-methyltransferase n=1 Tax=Necator americanus TaxID=51031 RepID=A0ABR1BIP6_NECAM
MGVAQSVRGPQRGRTVDGSEPPGANQPTLFGVDKLVRNLSVVCQQMPAVEQQLVECVHRVLRIPEPWRVGVVSGENDNNLELEGQFGESTTVNSIKGTNSIENFVDLDVLVVNQALDKELQDSSALDKFVSNALQSLRLGGACVIRQDLTALNDPKKVAKLTDYLDVFRIDEGGEKFGFSFYAVNEVEDSIYEFGLHVCGVDLSSNMLAVALQRIQRDKDSRVTYAICDATVYDFEPASFDYVFSRDCIQHIENTENLFSRIYRALKPGGKVLITMYGVGYGELSENFKRYVEQRQYYLKNTKQIREIAEKVGFTDIVVENMTGRFEEILEEERQRVENNKEEFLSKFSQNEYDSLVNGWNAKLQFIADDNHNWNLFLAVKPQ